MRVSAGALAMVPLFGAAFVLRPAPVSAQTRAGLSAPERMSPAELEDQRYIHAHTQPHRPYRLDLAHPVQWRFVLRALTRAGRSPRTAPQLFRALEAARARGRGAAPALAVAIQSESTPQDLNYINRFDVIEAPNVFEADALSSIPGGTERTDIIVQLYNLASGHLLAAGDGAEFCQGVYFKLPLSAANDAVVPTTEAQAWFLYVPRGAPPHEVTVAYFRAEATVNAKRGCLTRPNYCVRDVFGNCVSGQYQTTCTNQVADNSKPIKVCYTRGSQQECDYFHQGPAHPTDFVFPLQGWAAFDNQVFSAGGVPKGSVTITLENPLKGGGCYMEFRTDLATWSVDKTQVSWNYAAAAFPDPKGCLEYYGGTDMYLNLTAYVSLEGTQPGPPPLGIFTFTSDRQQGPGPGVFIVPPMRIEQGCLAAGTRIRMADGSTRAVESFSADHREQVRSAEGVVRVVLGTSDGTERWPLVRLKTAGGHELLLTRSHPVVVPGAVLLAQELQPGQQVLTETGPSALVSVTREPYAGKVHNLRIGDDEDARAGRSTLFANGILVGDLRTQAHYERLDLERRRGDPRRLLQCLAPEWHADFELHQAREPRP